MLDTLKSHCILIYECCKYYFIPKYNFRFVKKKIICSTIETVCALRQYITFLVKSYIYKKMPSDK